MAVADETMTQVGTSKPVAGRSPCAISASVMMPIVFWASLVPWASENIEPETSCPSR